MFHGVLFVSRIDAFRTISAIKIHVHLQARDLFHHRNTFVFCHSRINGGFIYHHITFADDFAHCGACTHKRSKVWIVVVIHRSRNGHNVEIAIANLLYIAGANKAMIVDGILQQLITHL